MRYYNQYNAPQTGVLNYVERNALNPIYGLSFVSIAYYTNPDGTRYAVIF